MSIHQNHEFQDERIDAGRELADLRQFEANEEHNARRELFFQFYPEGDIHAQYEYCDEEMR
jgi:hypothetical protein